MIWEIFAVFVLISYYYLMWPVVLGSMTACATVITQKTDLGHDAKFVIVAAPFFIILCPWIPTYIAIT